MGLPAAPAMVSHGPHALLASVNALLLMACQPHLRSLAPLLAPSRLVSYPTYACNDNICGFFCMFEWWCEAGAMTNMNKVAQLCSVLQDDACDFVQSLSSLDTMTYQELKTQLIDTFGAREAEHVNKLWSFKHCSMLLDNYVTKFCKLRNQAAPNKEREDL